MANTKNKKKSSSNKRKTTNKRTSSQTQKRTQKKTETKTNISNDKPSVGFGDFFHAFSKTSAFKFILFFLIFILAFALNLLLSWNDFDRFFLISGIEIIIAACVYVFLLISGKK